MKAFEEKFPREICSIEPNQNTVDFCREKKREGWKAALEWVLQLKSHDLNAEAIDRFNEYYHISDCGLHIIEEELKQ